MLFDDHFDKIGKIAHSLCLLMKGLFSPSEWSSNSSRALYKTSHGRRGRPGGAGEGAEGGWVGRAFASRRLTPAGDSWRGYFCPRLLLLCLRPSSCSSCLPSRRCAAECRPPLQFTRGKFVGNVPLSSLLGLSCYSYVLLFIFSVLSPSILHITYSKSHSETNEKKKKTKTLEEKKRQKARSVEGSAAPATAVPRLGSLAPVLSLGLGSS